MKKRVVLVMLAAMVVSLIAAAASLAAEPAPRRHVPLGSPGGPLQSPDRLAHMESLAEAGLAARLSTQQAPSMVLSGPCLVSGHVYNWSGTPVANALVEIYDSPTASEYFAVLTDAAGAFEFAGFPETAGGELWVALPNGDYLWNTALTFTAAGPNDFDLRPGRVGFRLVEGGLWSDFPLPKSERVRMANENAGASTLITQSGGNALAMAPGVDSAIEYLYSNQAVEVLFGGSPIAVTPGVTNGSVDFDYNNLREVYIVSPYWWSGKAGGTARTVLVGWPAGQTVAVTGYSDSPTPTARSFGSFATSGSSEIYRSVTIPATAPAGYKYNLVFSRTDSGSQMELVVPYQVASFKASKTSIYRGGSVYVTGRVPVEDRWGSTPGKKKTVTLYRRSTSAAPPTNWSDPSKNGWTRVGSYTANGYGVFKTGSLRPTRSTSYVVRYPGDNEYDRGFTSVIRVSVK